MNSDLTPKLLLAEESDWDPSRFKSLLEASVRAIDRSSVDWDSGAGEEWARVVVGTQVAALLWSRVPFAFTGLKYAKALVPVMASYAVQCEVLADWDAVEFVVDLSVVESIAGRCVASAFDSRGFSANDLWWATI